MECLTKIQNEIKATKDLRNDFGKYNYRSAESIMAELKPLCDKYGVQVYLEDDIQAVNDRIYIKATAVYREKDEEVRVSAFAREPDTRKGMDGSQVTGSSSSYARKYALGGLLMLDDNKDVDSLDNRQNNHNEEASKKIGNEQISIIKEFCTQTETNIDEMLKYFGYKKLEDVTTESYSKIVTMLNKKMKQKNEK